MKKLLSILALAVIGLSFTSCFFFPDDKPKEKSGVDFTNYSTGDYVIKVTNNTAKKLVAFKGTPSATTLMGGIPATTSNHGLKLNEALFPDSTDFVLFVVSEEDYIEKRQSLTELANTPFARLYAYYNKNAPNNYVYQISSKMGGNGKLTFNNNTGFNVELRKDGIFGETIGYAAADTINTTFSLDFGDYYIFPVFRKFDPVINEIVTVYPKYSGLTGTDAAANGKAIVELIALTSDTPSRTINSNKWKTEKYTFASGYAYIRITNSSSVDIQLFNGANSDPLMTSTGSTFIPSGETKTFTLEMAINNQNSNTGFVEYQDFKSYSQFYVGNALSKPIYLTGDSTTTFDYYGGKIYDYTVLGETAYTLVVTANPTVSDMEFVK